MAGALAGFLESVTSALLNKMDQLSAEPASQEGHFRVDHEHGIFHGSGEEKNESDIFAEQGG